MYVCMYVCMYVWMYVYIHTCVYVYISGYPTPSAPYISISIFAYLHICMYMYLCMYVYAYVCMCVRVHIHVHACMYACIYMTDTALLYICIRWGMESLAPLVDTKKSSSMHEESLTPVLLVCTSRPVWIISLPRRIYCWTFRVQGLGLAAQMRCCIWCNLIESHAT